MWIEPNGVVKILQNIPIDNDYTHTLYFTDRTTQYNYFNSKVKYTYNKITYQRVKRNYMRVEINAENLYDCNYIMFQNTSFGNKWFYAFIKKVEYIANMVSEIEYEIDEMQTWFWECELRESFVEREHSLTDDIGDNLVPENLELGEYVMHVFTPSHATLDIGRRLLEEQVIIVACTFNDDYTDYGGTCVNRIFSGLRYKWFTFDDNGVQACINFLEGAITQNKESGIIDIFQVPFAFVYSILPQQEDKYNAHTYQWGDTKPLANIDGYYPQNNKLFTHPYNFLYVTDGHGNSAEYPYEYFEGDNFNFEYSFALSCDPSMMLSPVNYKGVSGANYNERMVYKGFPHCSWNNDTWKMWLAQNGGSLFAVATPIGAGLLATAGGMATGNMLVGAGGVLSVINSLKQVVSHATMPPQAKGNYNGDIIYSNKINDYWFGYMHIRSEFAKIIDKFFTMFGYATKLVKVPNINSRPHFNYVKTDYCNIVGSIPADSLAKIQSIFKTGITFWKNANEVGDYSVNNKPV